MRRLAAVLLWSILAAAFIGPGTVTTAASAGAGFGYTLLWALVFSTVACLVLQEASARLTVVTGANLGQALRQQYPGGVAGSLVLLLVVGAIVVGCAAYQAGNVLGAVAGAVLAIDASPAALAALCGLVAGLLLWFNAPPRVARLLAVLVAAMGAAFVWTAVQLAPPALPLLRGALVPALPAGSALLALGLVGTTVVPYNLFLGSGLAAGQRLGELRFGLTVAIGAGGLISMAVVVAGTALEGPFSYAGMAAVLAERLGVWGGRLFALGLFCAGLSSAITAPLAAAVTARSLFGEGGEDERWSERSWRYRAVWLGVVATGLGFGLAEAPPVPVILVAQALNGVLLPVVAVFLLLAVNDRRVMGEAVNGAFSNLLTGAVTLVTLVLGAAGLARAAAAALGRPAPGAGILAMLSLGAALAVALPVVRALGARRRPR